MSKTDHHARHDATQPWRSWYKSERWKALRLKVFLRDSYVCQRSGVLCTSKAPSANSPVANHKKPHHGDPELFWDIDNIETVTKEVHDSLIQREEKAGIVMGSDINGRPIDPNHPWNRGSS